MARWHVSPNCRMTPRKEAFARHYVEVGQGAEAARLAGYKTKYAKTRASLLLKEPPVQALIEQHRQELQERHRITVDQLVSQLNEDREFARATRNATAAVRASELLGKLSGHLVDRVDQRTIGGLKIELVSYDGHHSPHP